MATSWTSCVVVTLASLLIAGAAFALANFGAPAWLFALLLGWMATVGLPTSVAIAVTASLWDGVSPAAFVLSVAAFAFVLQLVSVRWVQRRLA